MRKPTISALCVAMVAWAVGCGSRTNPGGNCPLLPGAVAFPIVQAKVLNSCKSCHSRTAKNRFGAPNEVNFDTYDDAVKYDDAANSDILGGRMPPSGPIEDPNTRCLFDAWIKNGHAQ